MNLLLPRKISKVLSKIYWNWPSLEKMHIAFFKQVGDKVRIHNSQELLFLHATRRAVTVFTDLEEVSMRNAFRAFVTELVDALEYSLQFCIYKKNTSHVIAFDPFTESFHNWLGDVSEEEIDIKYVGKPPQYDKFENNCRLILTAKIASRIDLINLGIIPDMAQTNTATRDPILVSDELDIF